MMRQRRAQDSDIGIAVYGDGIDAAIAAIDLAQGRMEGVVVDSAAYVRERAVEVEQIGIELTPVEGSGRHPLQCSGREPLLGFGLAAANPVALRASPSSRG